MKTIVARVMVALLVSVGAATISGPGQAQTAGTTVTPGKTVPSAETTGPKRKKPRTAASIECSRQADTKGLHGKPRKEFRRTCLKQAAMLKKK